MKPLGICGLLWNRLLTKVSSVDVQDRNLGAVGEAPHLLIPSFLWLSWSVNFWSHSFFSHTWSSNALLIFSSAPHPLVVITLNFVKGGVPYTILSSWPPVRNIHWRARLAFLHQNWMLGVWGVFVYITWYYPLTCRDIINASDPFPAKVKDFTDFVLIMCCAF